MPALTPATSSRRRSTSSRSASSQVLFPIVLLLGLNGLLVGILNAYDHFTIPALAPLVWNFVIIGLLVVLKPRFDADEQLYAYAIAVVAATFVQLAMAVPVLRRLDFQFERKVDFRDPRVQAGARAHAAGDAQPRPHQLQHAHQLAARRGGLRGGAARDRRGVSDLHAAAGDVLASPSRRCCSRRSRGWPRAATTTACAR